MTRRNSARSRAAWRVPYTMVGIVRMHHLRIARGSTELEPGHCRNEEVVPRELEADRPRRDLADAGDRIQRRQVAQVVVAITGDRPERQEPVAPAWRGRDQHHGGDACVLGGEQGPVHGAEVVANQPNPLRVDVGAGGKQIDGRTVARDLVANAGRIGHRVSWIARPREASLRQERDHAVLARQTDSLLHELGPVAVRRLRVEPVEEEDRGAAATQGRLDQECLGIVRDLQVVDPRAVAFVRARDVRHRCSSALGLQRTYADTVDPVRWLHEIRRAHESVPKEQASDLGDRSHRCRYRNP